MGRLNVHFESNKYGSDGAATLQSARCAGSVPDGLLARNKLHLLVVSVWAKKAPPLPGPHPPLHGGEGDRRLRIGGLCREDRVPQRARCAMSVPDGPSCRIRLRHGYGATGRDKLHLGGRFENDRACDIGLSGCIRLNPGLEI